MSDAQKEIKLSIQKVIDLIRTVRNDLIKDFLDDQVIQSFFIERYNKELSKVRMEFLKKDLKELLISPVDLVHYATLINQIRETDSASLSQGNQEIFYKEMESIFKKYDYV